jgi:rubrerythrin
MKLFDISFEERLKTINEGRDKTDPDYLNIATFSRICVEPQLERRCKYCGSIFARNHSRCDSCGAPRAYI